MDFIRYGPWSFPLYKLFDNLLFVENKLDLLLSDILECRKPRPQSQILRLPLSLNAL